MANIIEREIAKREVIIAEHAEKIAKVDELKAELDKLVAELSNTNVDVLQDEINELKGYLPKVEVENSEQKEEVCEINNTVEQVVSTF